MKIHMKHKLLFLSTFYNFSLLENEMKQEILSQIKQNESIRLVSGLENIPVMLLNTEVADT